MTRFRWLFAILAVLVLLSGIGWRLLTLDAVRPRVDVITMKARGGFEDLSWGEVLTLVRSGRGPQLRALVNVGNPFAAISNPFATEIAQGAELFESECSSCHGSGGGGGAAPDLTAGDFQHGHTDWALFRTITRGIPGTSMAGLPVPDRKAWQLVAFIRSISTGASDRATPGPAANVSPVPDERLKAAAREPGNWLMYSGTFDGTRYSQLADVNQQTVAALRLKWVYQFESANQPVEAVPVVVDGVMYVTEPPSNVAALDAATGRLIWKYKRTLPGRMRTCCWHTNRGVAIAGRRVYVGTLDAHLVALVSATGQVVWDVEVGKADEGFSITSAPLAANGKILIGTGGGEFGIRGFIDAYDAATGNRAWRFYTIPGPGEPGHDTWSGDSWRKGGGPTWLTGSFDPDLGLVYWGVGNPSPSYNGSGRPGDNLYTNSVVALDVDSGRLRWHFQFTPHDEHDWDANQIPVLVDRSVAGAARKLMLWANRNGFYYVLDRETGRFLHGQPFVKQTRAKGLTPEGRPIPAVEALPSPRGTLVWPGNGGTNWWSPSYSPKTDRFYVHAHERPSVFVSGATAAPQEREFFEAGKQSEVPSGKAFIRALKADTGTLAWEYALGSGPSLTVSHGGLLSTAGNLVFGGNGEGQFVAVDAENGTELWRTALGGSIFASPITFTSDSRQVIAVAAGRNLFAFELGK
jgi:alcohol dehydrogenase (cytochrome c)